MCDYVTDEHVVTYDPSYVDEHSDSTDFDDNYSMTVSKKYHKRKKPLVKKTRAEKELSMTQLKELYRKREEQATPKNTTMNASTSFCHHCGSLVKNHPERYIPLSQPDKKFTNAPDTSKVNVLKQKISSIFFRANRRYMPPIEENNAFDCKVYCADCRWRQIKKLRRKQAHAPRPVYLVDNVPTGPLSINKEVPNSPYRLPGETASYSTSLSSNSEKVLWKEMLYKRRKDDELENQFKKEFMKYNKEKEKQLKSRSQQYSKHDKYEVFVSQNHQCCQAESPSPRQDSAAGFGNGLPATASGFWEFLMNKLNARYQEAKSLSDSLGCCQTNCRNPLQIQDPKRNELSQNIECQTQPQAGSFEPSSHRSKMNSSGVSSSEFSQLRPFLLSGKTYNPLSSQKSNTPVDIGCECNPDLINQAQRVKKLSPKSTQVLPSDSKSCQVPHDEMTKVLKEKYNGEVLCIHNPPCVLINGCLNVPQQPVKTTPVSVWPTFAMATREKKLSYLSCCKKHKKAKSKKCEQACQYHPPYEELQQYQSIQEYDAVVKTEKLIQCICNHSPPCKIVPGCFKPKYDPQLVNSCIHVPMCKKIPECLTEVDQDKNTCDHKPRCFEVPECRRNYVIERGDVHRQPTVRAGTVCRHQPPCLMVPRCLRQVFYDSVVAYEAIPNCMHHPPCELIPACCRKSIPKDALSTIRPPFNKGVDIKIPRMPVYQYNRLSKIVSAYRK